MKRSKAITLTLLTSVSLAVMACDGEKMVQTTQECMESTGNSELWCQKTMEQAKANAEKSAPRFKTKEECVAEFGESACQPRTETRSDGSSTSWFMPAMMGYMIGSNSASRGYVEPAYVTRDGNAYTPSTYSANRVRASRASSASRSSVSRGGFGGGYHGSFGG